MKSSMDSDRLKQQILQLKHKKHAVILAHNYQVPEIQEIADFVGDSLELARLSTNTDADIIVFCGVRFMAETAKILSPDKKVLLPKEDVGCPLADSVTVEDLLLLKQQHPAAVVVTYVNTSAEIKAISDVCCTSANAVEVVRNVATHTVIFLPDRNLGDWVRKNLPDKEVIVWPGYCYVHERFTVDEIHEVKSKHPDSVLLVHPECKPEVVQFADVVTSTSGMLRYAKTSDSRTFIIGTEEGLIYRLKKENPNKSFYSLGTPKVCFSMKKIRLMDVYNALQYEQHEIKLDNKILTDARNAITAMLQYKG